MGRIFNWFSWQLERRVMAKEMDRLRDELAESKEQLLYAKRDIAELRSENEILSQSITEPAETELERKAWELWLRGDDSIDGAWRKAELWLRARESKRNGQERLTDEQ